MIRKIDRSILLLIPITILFLILASIKAGSTSLWLDEIMSLDFCDSGIRDLFQELKYDVHAPLFYLILYLFVKIGGISEYIGRIPGILAGAGTIGGLWILGKELCNRRASFLAALFLACSPFFLEFSREIHPYSLSAFFSVLSWLYFIRIMKKGERLSILLYAFFTGFLLLTFYLAFLVTLSQFIYFYARRRARRKKRGIVAAWIIGILIFSFWMPIFFSQLSVNKIAHDVGVYFPEGIKPYHVYRLLSDIFLGTWAQASGSRIDEILLGIFIIPSLILILLNKKQLKYKKYLVIWMFWGIILLFTILCLIKPLYLSRYMTLSTPFACLFLAVAVDRIKSKIKYGIIAILISGELFSYGLYLKKMPRENWKDPAVYLVNHIQPKDAIVTDYTNSTSCLIYYFKILGKPELNRNTFAFDQFFQHTGGVYSFSDRTLWYLSRETEMNQKQLSIIRQHNTQRFHISFVRNFQIYSFKGGKSQ